MYCFMGTKKIVTLPPNKNQLKIQRREQRGVRKKMLSRKPRAKEVGYTCGQVGTKLARLTPSVTGNVGPGEYGEQRRPSWPAHTQLLL